MPLEAFDLPRQPIEPAAKRCFHPLGIVRRQKRRKRGLDDKSLRPRACGWRSRRVGRRDQVADETCAWFAWLALKDRSHRPDPSRPVARDRGPAVARLECARPHRRLFVPEGEFRRRLCWSPHDLFVLRKFRLAADAAIRGIGDKRLARRADFPGSGNGGNWQAAPIVRRRRPALLSQGRWRPRHAR